MIVFKRIADLTAWLEKQRNSGKSIGFVPTLGALHEGHISLINISKKASQITVCSIFVNPTQFNDPKDFEKYPVTLEKDIVLLEKAAVDVLFHPGVSELYPSGTTGLEHYDLGRLETLLEGKSRPGHFQGVCQVMSRLLTVVRPDQLFMGQKDYQQCMVIQRLLALMDLPTRLRKCPIIREPDGLAMSSRNLRLTPPQRARATAIYRALLLIKEKGRHSGDTAIREGEALLKQADFQIDYITIADAATLEPITPAATSADIVALIAAFQGEIRLIDNMLI
jgi:pantoate--beta-alanine ligase